MHWASWLSLSVVIVLLSYFVSYMDDLLLQLLVLRYYYVSLIVCKELSGSFLSYSLMIRDLPKEDMWALFRQFFNYICQLVGYNIVKSSSS